MTITVYASDLTAGMYIYTLVVDGKVAVTRRISKTKPHETQKKTIINNTQQPKIKTP